MGELVAFASAVNHAAADVHINYHTHKYYSSFIIIIILHSAIVARVSGKIRRIFENYCDTRQL